MEVVFEDKSIVVINKPAGVVVNRSKSTPVGTIQDWMEQKYPELEAKAKKAANKLWLERSGLVHRIDKQTSGLLVLAKNEVMLKKMMRLFKEREIKKSYTALTHGWFELEKGEIGLPLGRLPYNRFEFGVVVGGKMSQTYYEVMSKWSRGEGKQESRLSLVKVGIKTGRTHQIRVVMKHLGHALVADDVYLGKRQLKNDLDWCPRLFLHASELSFVHPETDREVALVVGLPDDLQTALDGLREV